VLSAVSISFIAALVAALGERPIRRYRPSSSRKCRLLVSALLSPLRRRMRFGLRSASQLERDRVIRQPLGVRDGVAWALRRSILLSLLAGDLQGLTWVWEVS
jgi:hypothetical protein